MASAPKHTAGIAANRPRTDQQYGVRFVGFYNPRLDPRGKYVMSAPYTRFEMFCAEAALGHFQKYEKTDNTPSEGEQGAYARFRGWHHHSTRLLCESMNNFFTATKLWTTNAHIRSNEPTYDPKTFVASWDPQPINQFQEMTDHSPVLPGPAYEDRHAETQLWNKYQGFDHNQAANLMEAADVSFKAWSSRWQGKGKARKDVLAYYRKLNFFNERLPVLSPYRSPSFSAVAECRESDLDQLREIYLPFLQAMERYPFGGDAVDQQVWFQLFEDEIPDFTPIDHHMDIDTQWGSLEDMVLYMHEQGEDDYTAPDVSIMEKYGFAGSRDLYCASFILAWNGNTAAFVAATNPDSTTEAKHPTRLLVNMTDVCAGAIVGQLHGKLYWVREGERPEPKWLHIVNGVYIDPYMTTNMAALLDERPTGLKSNVVLVWQAVNHWSGLGPTFRVMVMAKHKIPRLDVLVLDVRP